MKRIILSLSVILLFSSSAFAGEDAPLSLAGIHLGDDFHKYEHLLRMEHAGAMADAVFLNEALIRTGAIHGVRGGSVIWGNCANSGKVLRVKIKFADTSEELFKKLLVRFEEHFGEPTRYQGDSFRNVIAWEWEIADDDGRHVRIQLMYSVDPSVRPGVSIKMTDQTLLDLEFACYKKKYREKYRREEKAGKIDDLDMFVPK